MPGKHFIVLDEGGERSCDAQGKHETFDDIADAKARTVEFAVLNPGVEIFTYEAVSVAKCGVAPVTCANLK
ncbi:MAG: hypothetical protein WD871_01845 [Xanthobacteraceae bacterium]